MTLDWRTRQVAQSNLFCGFCGSDFSVWLVSIHYSIFLKRSLCKKEYESSARHLCKKKLPCCVFRKVYCYSLCSYVHFIFCTKYVKCTPLCCKYEKLLISTQCSSGVRPTKTAHLKIQSALCCAVSGKLCNEVFKLGIQNNVNFLNPCFYI